MSAAAGVTASAPVRPPGPVGGSGPGPGWDEIARRAPQLAATVKDYLAELEGYVSAASVAAAEVALRQFAGRVNTFDPGCVSVAGITSDHVDDYRVWLAGRPGRR